MRKNVFSKVALSSLALFILGACAWNQGPQAENPYAGPNYNAANNGQGGYGQYNQGGYGQDQNPYNTGNGSYDGYGQQGGYNQGGYDQGGYGQQQGGYNQGYDQGGYGQQGGYNNAPQPSYGGQGGTVNHVIRRGDTIYGIAKKYGVSENDIRRWNNIVGDRINAGDRLVIHTGGSGASYDNSSYNQPQVSSGGGSRTVAGIRWSRPTQGSVITGYSSKSLGVDFGGSHGQPVYAAADGVVEWADPNSGSVGIPKYGRSVMIQHDSKYLTLYSFLSQVTVKKGKRVSKGQEIGRMGKRGGRSLLHFEIRKDGKPQDPFLYLP